MKSLWFYLFSSGFFLPNLVPASEKTKNEAQRNTHTRCMIELLQIEEIRGEKMAISYEAACQTLFFQRLHCYSFDKLMSLVDRE